MTEPKLQNGLWAMVVDPDNVRLLGPIDENDALTLLLCSAEDPANWNDVVIVWPRYAVDSPNIDSPAQLPIRELKAEEAVGNLSDAAAWCVIDLVQRRVFTGGQFPQLEWSSDPSGKNSSPGEIVLLPPWWELHQHVTAEDVLILRVSPPAIPQTRRDILWGSAMVEFFADRMMKVVRNPAEWADVQDRDNPNYLYELTKVIHRDWLMLPHPKLENGTPRDHLHVARNWMEHLVNSQSSRIFHGERPIPITEQFSGFEAAPMGLHEVVMYFDACRETISFGWSWLLEDHRWKNSNEGTSQLAQAMSDFLTIWRGSPFEGVETPDEIIRQERLRIPLIEQSDHLADCNCPICDMMASGAMGPAICGFDGHHLELDDEFAFSLCTTREEWAEQQEQYNEWPSKVSAEVVDLNADSHDSEDEDEFESEWKWSYVSSEGIPGDRTGHLGLAFLLTEVVSELQHRNAPPREIQQLNSAFRDFRSAKHPTDCVDTASHLKNVLEDLTVRYSELTGRVADLQSRINENVRIQLTH